MGGLNKLTAKDKDVGKNPQSHSSNGGGASEATEHSEIEKVVENIGSEKTHSAKTISEVDLALPTVAKEEEETADDQGKAPISGDEVADNSGSSASSAPSTPATEVPPAPESPPVAPISPGEEDTADREQAEEPKPLLLEEKRVDDVSISAE